MKNRKRKVFASFLSLMLVFSMMITNSTAQALGELVPFGNYTTTHVKDSNLISSVSNPSNGKISFVLTIPSGCTAEYAVELIPNDRTGSIDTVSGSYRNTSSSTMRKSVTVSVRYFCTRYTISASYETGTPQNRYIHEDEKAAKSVLKNTVYSTPFYWTEDEVKLFEQGKRVEKMIVTGSSVTFVLIASYAAGPLGGAGMEFLFRMQDVYEEPEVTTLQIMHAPNEGLGFKIRFEPYNDGYKRTLYVLDANGRTLETHPMPTVPGGMISRVF